jgi:hypothetical protein
MIFANFLIRKCIIRCGVGGYGVWIHWHILQEGGLDIVVGRFSSI